MDQYYGQFLQWGLKVTRDQKIDSKIIHQLLEVAFMTPILYQESIEKMFQQIPTVDEYNYAMECLNGIIDNQPSAIEDFLDMIVNVRDDNVERLQLEKSQKMSDFQDEINKLQGQILQQNEDYEQLQNQLLVISTKLQEFEDCEDIDSSISFLSTVFNSSELSISVYAVNIFQKIILKYREQQQNTEKKNTEKTQKYQKLKHCTEKLVSKLNIQPSTDGDDTGIQMVNNLEAYIQQQQEQLDLLKQLGSFEQIQQQLITDSTEISELRKQNDNSRETLVQIVKQTTSLDQETISQDENISQLALDSIVKLQDEKELVEKTLSQAEAKQQEFVQFVQTQIQIGDYNLEYENALQALQNNLSELNKELSDYREQGTIENIKLSQQTLLQITEDLSNLEHECGKEPQCPNFLSEHQQIIAKIQQLIPIQDCFITISNLQEKVNLLQVSDDLLSENQEVTKQLVSKLNIQPSTDGDDTGIQMVNNLEAYIQQQQEQLDLLKQLGSFEQIQQQLITDSTEISELRKQNDNSRETLVQIVKQTTSLDQETISQDENISQLALDSIVKLQDEKELVEKTLSQAEAKQQEFVQFVQTQIQIGDYNLQYENALQALQNNLSELNKELSDYREQGTIENIKLSQQTLLQITEDLSNLEHECGKEPQCPNFLSEHQQIIAKIQQLIPIQDCFITISNLQEKVNLLQVSDDLLSENQEVTKQLVSKLNIQPSTDGDDTGIQMVNNLEAYIQQQQEQLDLLKQLGSFEQIQQQLITDSTEISELRKQNDNSRETLVQIVKQTTSLDQETISQDENISQLALDSIVKLQDEKELVEKTLSQAEAKQQEFVQFVQTQIQIGDYNLEYENALQALQNNLSELNKELSDYREQGTIENIKLSQQTLLQITEDLSNLEHECGKEPQCPNFLSEHQQIIAKIQQLIPIQDCFITISNLQEKVNLLQVSDDLLSENQEVTKQLVSKLNIQPSTDGDDTGIQMVNNLEAYIQQQQEQLDLLKQLGSFEQIQQQLITDSTEISELRKQNDNSRETLVQIVKQTTSLDQETISQDENISQLALDSIVKLQDEKELVEKTLSQAEAKQQEFVQFVQTQIQIGDYNLEYENALQALQNNLSELNKELSDYREQGTIENIKLSQQTLLQITEDLSNLEHECGKEPQCPNFLSEHQQIIAKIQQLIPIQDCFITISNLQEKVNLLQVSDDLLSENQEVTKQLVSKLNIQPSTDGDDTGIQMVNNLEAYIQQQQEQLDLLKQLGSFEQIQQQLITDSTEISELRKQNDNSRETLVQIVKQTTSLDQETISQDENISQLALDSIVKLQDEKELVEKTLSQAEAKQQEFVQFVQTQIQIGDYNLQYENALQALQNNLSELNKELSDYREQGTIENIKLSQQTLLQITEDLSNLEHECGKEPQCPNFLSEHQQIIAKIQQLIPIQDCFITISNLQEKVNLLQVSDDLLSENQEVTKQLVSKLNIQPSTDGDDTGIQMVNNLEAYIQQQQEQLDLLKQLGSFEQIQQQLITDSTEISELRKQNDNSRETLVQIVKQTTSLDQETISQDENISQLALDSIVKLQDEKELVEKTLSQAEAKQQEFVQFVQTQIQIGDYNLQYENALQALQNNLSELNKELSDYREQGTIENIKLSQQTLLQITEDLSNLEHECGKEPQCPNFLSEHQQIIAKIQQLIPIQDCFITISNLQEKVNLLQVSDDLLSENQEVTKQLVSKLNIQPSTDGDDTGIQMVNNLEAYIQQQQEQLDLLKQLGSFEQIQQQLITDSTEISELRKQNDNSRETLVQIVKQTTSLDQETISQDENISQLALDSIVKLQDEKELVEKTLSQAEAKQQEFVQFVQTQIQIGDYNLQYENALQALQNNLSELNKELSDYREQGTIENIKLWKPELNSLNDEIMKLRGEIIQILEIIYHDEENHARISLHDFQQYLIQTIELATSLELEITGVQLGSNLNEKLQNVSSFYKQGDLGNLIDSILDKQQPWLSQKEKLKQFVTQVQCMQKEIQTIQIKKESTRKLLQNLEENKNEEIELKIQQILKNELH